MGGSLVVVTRSDKKRAVYVDESHVTVIKRSPAQPLELDMYRTAIPRTSEAGVENPLFTTASNLSFAVNNTMLEVGDSFQTSITFDTQVDFREGDIVLLVRQDFS